MNTLAQRVQHRLLQEKRQRGEAVLDPAAYDRGYWDHADYEEKSDDYYRNPDYRNGWDKAEADTEEIAFLAGRR